jgi:hypothetical protein
VGAVSNELNFAKGDHGRTNSAVATRTMLSTETKQSPAETHMPREVMTTARVKSPIYREEEVIRLANASSFQRIVPCPSAPFL